MSPWVVFPAWHCCACQILFKAPTPILSLYAEEEFGEGVVWSGRVLFVATSCLALTAVVWGWIIDRVSPFRVMLFSSIALPLVSLTVGPIPPLSPSKSQLFLALCNVAVLVPPGCITAMAAMIQAYQIHHSTTEISPQVSSFLVSIYCASYASGVFLGFTLSGVVSKYLSFRYTNIFMSCVFFLETVVCVVYCVVLEKRGKRVRDVVIELPAAKVDNE